MKKIITILLSVICTGVTAQNIGIGTNSPNTSALLDITSTSKGLLIPRMTQAQRTAIIAPAQGLLVYQTDGTVGFYVNRSSLPSIPNWSLITEGSGLWQLSPSDGNSIYNSNTKYVGVGTNAPQTPLHVSTATDTALIQIENTANLAAQKNIGMYFKTGNYYTGAVKTTGTAGFRARLGFYTGANSSAGLMAERLTISNAGTVGIGNTSPEAPLSFDSVANGNKIALKGYAFGPHYGLGVQNSLLQMYTLGRGTDIAFGFGESVFFTELMRIKGSGRTGIGTDNPSSLLEVAASDNEALSLNNKTAMAAGVKTSAYFKTGSFYTGAIETNATGGQDAKLVFKTGASNQPSGLQERMTILDNGFVGVATSSPQNLFTVSNDGIGVSQQSSDATTKVGFYTGPGTAYLQTHTNHDLNFATNNGSTQMVLKTSGNVGIGTTSPAYKLHVGGSAFSQTLAVTSTVSGLGSLVNFSNTGNGINTFLNGGSIGLFISGATSTGINVDQVTDAENAVVINKGRMKFKGGLANGFPQGITFTNAAGNANSGFIGMYNDNQMGLFGFTGSGWGVLYNVATGQVNLGASRNATGYKLNVGGKIMAEEVRVQLQAAWPDYVFADNYELMPLSALDNFISINKHLPGLRPASEIEKEGADLGETQRKLLEKVEELTLYIIGLRKEIDNLKKSDSK